MSRRALLVGAAVVVIGVGGVGMTAALAGDDVPDGVRVAGEDLGGLTRAEAEQRIAEVLRGPATAAVPVVAGGFQGVVRLRFGAVVVPVRGLPAR